MARKRHHKSLGRKFNKISKRCTPYSLYKGSGLTVTLLSGTAREIVDFGRQLVVEDFERKSVHSKRISLGKNDEKAESNFRQLLSVCSLTSPQNLAQSSSDSHVPLPKS